MRMKYWGMGVILLAVSVLYPSEKVYAYAEAPDIEMISEEDVMQEEQVQMKESGIPINEKYFPDEQFRHYLSYYDYDRDGYMSEAEIARNKAFDCSGFGIQDLTGIEHFTELVELKCEENELISLDVSQNKKLEILSCQDNQLRTLVLPDKSRLTYLGCIRNQLEELKLNNVVEMDCLECSDNQLESLELGETPYIDTIKFAGNQVTDLNLVRCRSVYGIDNKLEELDTEKCGDSLEELRVTRNNLKSLDLSKNTGLRHLTCSYNQLTTLGLSKNKKLLKVACSENQLKKIIFPKNTKLYSVACDWNKLESLDLSKIPELKYLQCEHNQLKTLKLPKRDMYVMDCSYNQLKKLDFSDMEIEELYCNDNKLTSLNVGPVEKLACGNNSFKTLDLRKARGLLRTDDLSQYEVKYVDIPKLTSITGTSKGIKISWSYPKKQCSGFYIYRKEKGGSWEKISRFFDSNRAGRRSYVDKTAKNKKTYTYTVRAFRHISRIDGYEGKDYLGRYDKKGLTFKK